jgi:hypothetical protein
VLEKAIISGMFQWDEYDVSECEEGKAFVARGFIPDGLRSRPKS